MEDPVEQLIRRAVGRRSPPRPGPNLVDEVLRRVAFAERAALVRRAARPRRRLAAAIWPLILAASAAALANVEWSSAARAVAWSLGLLLAPMTYAATVWLAGTSVPGGAGQPRHGGP